MGEVGASGRVTATGEPILVANVRDDGRGFDPRGNFPGHLGLHSMRERVQGAGGVLAIESAPGEGCTIRAILPAANAT